MKPTSPLLAALISTLILGVNAHGAIIPFTEEFSADAADWYDSAGTSELNWIGSGGPDSSSYASGNLNFAPFAAGNTPAILRAQDEFNSSGNAFVGNWIAQDVDQFSFFIRHNAPQPLTFFARLSSPFNFPAAAAVNFVPVQPNTWTLVAFPIVPGNPQFVFEGPPSTFNSVFSNIGHIQIGVSVPAGLAGVNESYTFDIDKPSIVPEPGVAGLLMMGIGVVVARRRIS